MTPQCPLSLPSCCWICWLVILQNGSFYCRQKQGQLTHCPSWLKLSVFMAEWLQPETCPFEWNHYTLFILSCLPGFRVYVLMSWRSTFPWWNQAAQGELWSLHLLSSKRILQTLKEVGFQPWAGKSKYYMSVENLIENLWVRLLIESKFVRTGFFCHVSVSDVQSENETDWLRLDWSMQD